MSNWHIKDTAFIPAQTILIFHPKFITIYPGVNGNVIKYSPFTSNCCRRKLNWSKTTTLHSGKRWLLRSRRLASLKISCHTLEQTVKLFSNTPGLSLFCCFWSCIVMMRMNLFSWCWHLVFGHNRCWNSCNSRQWGDRMGHRTDKPRRTFQHGYRRIHGSLWWLLSVSYMLKCFSKSTSKLG